MLATSSPYPLANIPAHVGGFLFASLFAKMWAALGREFGVGALVAAFTLTTLISWTLFSGTTWLGLSATDFVERQWSRLWDRFGTGFWGWWLYGFFGVAIPSLAVGLVLTPAFAAPRAPRVGGSKASSR